MGQVHGEYGVPRWGRSFFCLFVLVLIFTHIEKFSVSCMCIFFSCIYILFNITKKFLLLMKLFFLLNLFSSSFIVALTVLLLALRISLRSM